MVYRILRDAILSKKQVRCVYRGLVREICPHVLGIGKDGAERVLSFQFAGQSSKGLPPGGDWRCMRIDEISNVTMHNGAWHTRDNNLQQQTCVADVDVEVETE